MKHFIILASLALFSSPAFARTVECTGFDNDRREVFVSLATAAKNRISGIVITSEEDIILTHIVGAVSNDKNYRPSTRYASYQRYNVTSNRKNYLYLLLPEDKSGNYIAYLQSNLGTVRADTMPLSCAAR